MVVIVSKTPSLWLRLRVELLLLDLFERLGRSYLWDLYRK